MSQIETGFSVFQGAMCLIVSQSVSLEKKTTSFNYDVSCKVIEALLRRVLSISGRFLVYLIFISKNIRKETLTLPKKFLLSDADEHISIPIHAMSLCGV